MTSAPDQSTSVANLQSQIQRCMMQRQNMESIFNAVADGIIAFDLQLRVSNLNEAAQAMIGYSREEAVGESCHDLLPPASDRESFGALLANRREVDEHHAAVKDRHGRSLHLLLTTRVLRDDMDEVKGLVAILRDVTELEALRGELQQRESFYDLIGKDHRMQEIYRLVQDLSDSDATVLILGASGTGKELIASAIHRSSLRRRGPFVKVNCSALSESLLESELFGHVKGAFTGALRDKVGRFEEADSGTLFLDEIGDLSLAVQVKLLRVLQEREIERVGSNDPRKVDVRIIAATHRNLLEGIAEGRFREDLYYRLNVMSVELPALRERIEDIPALTDHFIAKYNARTGRGIQGIERAALTLLMDYEWPGNVRELENAIEHAFIKCRGSLLQPDCLPTLLQQDREVCAPHMQSTTPPADERHYIKQVLDECRWNRTIAAERLGMHRTTLWRKIKEWNLTED